ncbi:MAG: CinA family nicotinamide mononucleotide deamidase-related protein [Odoribacteraceae bacterium]|jgi:nicotinamide-nucleotide amidase|nr:CinA family nicotinamide mononucleotide deamidase-related protein [Odoribacteraceae bacterium]
MDAYIITIGDELLLGQVQDTNSRFIAGRLTRAGLEVVETRSIPDRAGRIAEVLDEALARAGVVVMTGGLGPTRDDVTKRVLAGYFHSRLVEDTAVLTWVEELTGQRGGEMNEGNRGQALLPEGCRVLHNPRGTAPGMWFEREGKVVVALPGVPFEMEYLMDHEVVPALRELFPDAMLDYRVVKVYGIAESALSSRLSGFEDRLPPSLGLAYLPSPGLVKLRLTARGEGIGLLDGWLDGLTGELSGTRFTVGEESGAARELGEWLSRAGENLSVAESCTGGEVAREITLVPGASAYFKGGVVAYSNEVKATLLGVSRESLARHGAVSEAVVTEMADGVRRLTGTGYAVAISGIAGPGGGSPEKPVGTVWIAVATPRGTVARVFHFPFTRERNVARAAMKAIEMAIDAVRESVVEAGMPAAIREVDDEADGHPDN